MMCRRGPGPRWGTGPCVVLSARPLSFEEEGLSGGLCSSREGLETDLALRLYAGGGAETFSFRRAFVWAVSR